MHIRPAAVTICWLLFLFAVCCDVLCCVRRRCWRRPALQPIVRSVSRCRGWSPQQIKATGERRRRKTQVLHSGGLRVAALV